MFIEKNQTPHPFWVEGSLSDMSRQLIRTQLNRRIRDILRRTRRKKIHKIREKAEIRK